MNTSLQDRSPVNTFGGMPQRPPPTGGGLPAIWAGMSGGWSGSCGGGGGGGSWIVTDMMFWLGISSAYSSSSLSEGGFPCAVDEVVVGVLRDSSQALLNSESVVGVQHSLVFVMTGSGHLISVGNWGSVGFQYLRPSWLSGKICRFSQVAYAF